MKILSCSQIIRFYSGSFVLLMIIVIAGIGIFRTSASNNANERSTKGAFVSVQLKSRNTAAVNLRPGRDLPTTYRSGDHSSAELKAGQNRPLALASADFDVDGFPDLAAGYSAPSGGGIVTFYKGNPEAFFRCFNYSRGS